MFPERFTREKVEDVVECEFRRVHLLQLQSGLGFAKASWAVCLICGHVGSAVLAEVNHQ